MAIETDRRWESDYAACDEAYDDALAAIERGDLGAAEAALEAASRRESAGGDNCDAHHALVAVRAAIAGGAA